MTIVVPTLSIEGFVSDIAGMTDRLMSYFFTSKYSQSTEYYGNITSLPYIVQKYGNDITALPIQTEKRLTDYLSRHFEQVTVDARCERINENSNTINLIIRVRITHNGKAYDLANEIMVTNAIVQDIKRAITG